MAKRTAPDTKPATTPTPSAPRETEIERMQTIGREGNRLFREAAQRGERASAIRRELEFAARGPNAATELLALEWDAKKDERRQLVREADELFGKIEPLNLEAGEFLARFGPVRDAELAAAYDARIAAVMAALQDFGMDDREALAVARSMDGSMAIHVRIGQWQHMHGMNTCIENLCRLGTLVRELSTPIPAARPGRVKADAEDHRVLTSIDN